MNESIGVDFDNKNWYIDKYDCLLKFINNILFYVV